MMKTSADRDGHLWPKATITSLSSTNANSPRGRASPSQDRRHVFSSQTWHKRSRRGGTSSVFQSNRETNSSAAGKALRVCGFELKLLITNERTLANNDKAR